jgi:asparagine synthase (glutamine-hydrolysing)
MCGIAGITWRDPDLAARMAEVIAHRGPDDSGLYADEAVSLSHRRLSIIDLSAHGHQPLSNEDGSIWIVYNGEIYNFQQLREDLEAKGHRFRSRTDTEVIVHAYEEYGIDCVRRFNGMFAFAIWDRNRREVLLARDRLGVKPLYYHLSNGRLVFASEIKAILQVPTVPREVNPQALYHYVGFEFVPAPDTMFQGIRKLPPGHHLRFREGDVRIERYWDVAFRDQERTPEEYRVRMRELLTESVRKRLISDVPLGVFLSGGLDSSAVVALMKHCGVEPLRTFSIGYKDPTFSELDYARVIARQFGTLHEELIIDPITPELIETAVWHLDEPMTDLSTIPLYLICERARRDVTVCLSGEGGDEVLVGYDRFKASKVDRYYSILPRWIRRDVILPVLRRLPDQTQKKGAVNVLKRFAEGSVLPPEGRHMRWQYFGPGNGDLDLFSAGLRPRITADPFEPIRRAEQHCSSQDRLDREIYIDLKFTMPDSVLMKVDKMSMAHGLEVRVPFLDYEFVEFCATIPGSMKLAGFRTKAIFREAMQGILPPHILQRGKQGYSLPIKNWLREDLRDYMTDTLTSSPLIAESFDPGRIGRLMEEHLTYRANHNHVLWALMNVAIWYRLFLDSAARPRAAGSPALGAADGPGGAGDPCLRP